MEASAHAHGVAELRTVLGERAQPIELREHAHGKVRPVLLPDLTAPYRDLREAQRIVQGPVVHGRIEEVGEGAVLQRARRGG